MERVTATADEPFVLHPGEFVLGTTVERVSLPADIVARLDGKSSLAVSGCSSTPLRAMWILVGTGRSPSNSRTWPTSPSSSNRDEDRTDLVLDDDFGS